MDDRFQLVPFTEIHQQFCIEAAVDPGNWANGGVLKEATYFMSIRRF